MLCYLPADIHQQSHLCSMKKFLKWFGLGLLAAFVVIQFFRPDRTNPVSDPAKSIWSDGTVPAGVKQTLRTSCADCHSNETVWPWYSEIAPASWLVAHDVEEGRGDLNLSEWGGMTAEDRAEAAEEMAKETKRGKMPLGNYTLLHGGAKLTDAQIAELQQWASTVKGAGSE